MNSIRRQGYGTIEGACYDLVVGVADDQLARTVAREVWGCGYAATTILDTQVSRYDLDCVAGRTTDRTPYETQEITPLGLLYFEVGKVAGTGLLRPERPNICTRYGGFGASRDYG